MTDEQLVTTNRGAPDGPYAPRGERFMENLVEHVGFEVGMEFCHIMDEVEIYFLNELAKKDKKIAELEAQA